LRYNLEKTMEIDGIKSTVCRILLELTAGCRRECYVIPASGRTQRGWTHQLLSDGKPDII
jgi:hypothetical protein